MGRKTNAGTRQAEMENTGTLTRTVFTELRICESTGTSRTRRSREVPSSGG
jgi:hypothetical protein